MYFFVSDELVSYRTAAICNTTNFARFLYFAVVSLTETL